ncbi:hypothetical protein [Actinomadura rugatobispora]|uniref:Dehydrogenase n=1 Tax=Actinomadura rugatobispora TaxID=1994 RepID=A0ABW0ZQ62_9ACTN|nr:hypothetical protein GCM10010200_035880 [Actinomadura rugatobispora]
MTALLSRTRRLLDRLLPGTPATPRLCTMCGRTARRLSPAHHADIGSKRTPTCRRWGCPGELWHAEDLAAREERQATRDRRLLAQYPAEYEGTPPRMAWDGWWR